MQTASLTWFARHELRLNWRDWTALMTGGKRSRLIGAAIVIAIAAIAAHLIAAVFITPWAKAGITADKATLVTLSGSGLLFFTVMLSQAMESVTRAYYARADLDLILSSPASARLLFAIRTSAIGLSTFVLSALLAGPAINVLAVADGPHWLFAYGVLAALAALATTLAVIFTLVLFHLAGPKRTRLIAQIAAAIVGAGFLIGIQLVAILAYGNISRFSVLSSYALVSAAPGLGSLLWLPARAAMGEVGPFALFAAGAIALFAIVVHVSSASFGHHAIAAAGVSETGKNRAARTRPLPARSQKQALRHKEWALLKRDPWLLSQTLMQILYLLPPALLMWLNFGQAASILIVVAPVLVMASGQLAGGLAWLTISGEDAPDLVATAPIAPGMVLRAKVEAVMIAVAVVLLPLILLMLVFSPMGALVTAVGIGLAATSATLIQIWFRAQAKRAMFRRRQVSSRIATLSEAFVSISWAGTAALAVSGSWLAIMPAIVALGVLALARTLSPKSVD